MMNTDQNAEGKVSAEQYFWAAAEKEQLLLPRCVDTGKCFFYPRDHSPFTGGGIDWVESDGSGEVYSFCVSGRGELYCLAYIKLDDGPIMLSNVLTDDFSTVEIGLRVKVSFCKDDTGRVVPFFKPDI